MLCQSQDRQADRLDDSTKRTDLNETRSSMRVVKPRWSGVSQSVFCATLCALLLAIGASTDAQEPKKVPRIGYLATTGQGSAVATFQRGLRDLGYIDGQNISIEFRYLNADITRIPKAVTELMQLKIDVFVSPLTSAVRAAKQASKTMPIVMIATQDPVAEGIIDSLAHPGGNVTGVYRLALELSGKRLELLKEMIPTTTKVGVLLDMEYRSAVRFFKEYESAARYLKIPLQSLAVHGSNPDLEGLFRDAVMNRISAAIVVRGGVVSRYRNEIANVAIKNRLPLMSESSNDVERGGLVSYSADETESYRRAATYVDKILKGAKAAELPVEQPTKFEFVINLKTAKQIGLTIPPNVLARADRVIR